MTKSERIQAELSLHAARDALKSARHRVQLARARWRHARATLGRWYRAARARARQRAREYRVRERERIRQQIEAWWADLQARWVARRTEIDRLGADRIAKTKRAADHRRKRLQELSSHKRRVAAEWSAVQKRERSQQSDEAVIRDLEAHHPELVAIFQSRPSSFRGGPRMSRTEAVLHWAHENPDELAALHSEREQRELQEAIREHEAAERAAYAAAKQAKGARVRKAKPRQNRALLAAVPF